MTFPKQKYQLILFVGTLHIFEIFFRMPVQVPSACARFRNDFYTSDGLLKEIFPNLLHLSDHEGGHFAAFQVPDVFSRDVFVAIEKFENFNSNLGAKA